MLIRFLLQHPIQLKLLFIDRQIDRQLQRRKEEEEQEQEDQEDQDQEENNTNS